MSEVNQEANVEGVVQTQEASSGEPTTESKPEAKYTDEDVNAIIDKKFAKWQKEMQAKEEQAKKLAKMNAEEKAEHERKQLEAELNELKREKAVASMEKEARKMLSEQQISVPDEVLGYFVTEEAESTKQGVEALVNMMNQAKKQWELERNRGFTPRETGNQAEINPFKEIIKKY